MCVPIHILIHTTVNHADRIQSSTDTRKKQTRTTPPSLLTFTLIAYRQLNIVSLLSLVDSWWYINWPWDQCQPAGTERVGSVECDQQGKYSPPWRGQTVRFFHFSTELSWPGPRRGQWDSFILPLSYHDPGHGEDMRFVHSPTEPSWSGPRRGQTVRFVHSPTDLSWPMVPCTTLADHTLPTRPEPAWQRMAQSPLNGTP